jgi:16S rRNA (cytosine1402-N4)-methyltransferase
MFETFSHEPVLKYQVAEFFAKTVTGPSPVIVDCTIGLGGHTLFLLNQFENLRVIGIDRDLVALDYAQNNLQGFEDRVSLAHDTFDNIGEVLEQFELETVDGFLFDLGVSSMQLDDPTRGFSFRNSEILDMRMDPSSGQSAQEVINQYSTDDLIEIFKYNSHERYAIPIARAIEKQRTQAPIKGTDALNQIVKKALPKGVNTAPVLQRVYQALRIEVNQEMSQLEKGLFAAYDHLAESGVIIVISYHSVEDRFVKFVFNRWVDPLNSDYFPTPDPNLRRSVWLNKNSGAILADSAEQEFNPRSRSARLRALQRVA